MSSNTRPKGSVEPPIPSAVPVFPLMKTVFFPNTLLPLHIFEERYRAMTRDTIAGDGFMVIALCDGNEQIRPVAGLGRIIQHEELEDGRFHILLQGIHRVRILEEHPMESRLYRRVRTEVIPDSQEDEKCIDEKLMALYRCVDRLVQSMPEEMESIAALTNKIEDPSILANVICAAIMDPFEKRQAALEELVVSKRLHYATDALAEILLNHFPQDGQVPH